MESTLRSIEGMVLGAQLSLMLRWGQLEHRKPLIDFQTRSQNCLSPSRLSLKMYKRSLAYWNQQVGYVHQLHGSSQFMMAK
ncbi:MULTISPECIES: hypothetical protein [Micrococcaceae]|uniref:hypothetical protein n=1 Tax=Micrococcaceae TaxID=1268 RepID=UPI001F5FA8F7|nr:MULTISPECIES: hypothetical protein [Micrococcaceae]UXN33080.1 hypothetical protein N6V40_06560 [Glutamicibacter sp. M10]